MADLTVKALYAPWQVGGQFVQMVRAPYDLARIALYEANIVSAKRAETLAYAVNGAIVLALCTPNELMPGGRWLNQAVDGIESLLRRLLKGIERAAGPLGEAVGRLLGAIGAFVGSALESMGVSVSALKRYFIACIVAYVVLKLYIQR